MNNDELKKKIMEIILQGVHAEPLDNSMAIEIADALIEAGIGDVKEAERKSFVFKNELAFTIHRAEVAERALEKACECIANIFNPYWKRDFFKQSYVKEYKTQAERELSEEGK